MIDLSRETILSFNEARQHLPRRRAGKRPNTATLYRWASVGIRGVQLETIRVGGTLCTSLEALQRFSGALSRRWADLAMLRKADAHSGPDPHHASRSLGEASSVG